MKPITGYACCHECGCTDVQAEAWVEINTSEVQDYTGGENYCPQCDDDAWEEVHSSLSELAEGCDSTSTLITRLAWASFYCDLTEDMERLAGKYGDYRGKVPEGFDLWDAETWGRLFSFGVQLLGR